MRTDGALAIAKALPGAASLQELNLRLNALGDAGGAEVLRALGSGSSSVTALDLACCELRKEAAAVLVSTLRANDSLEELNLFSNECAGGESGLNSCW